MSKFLAALAGLVAGFVLAHVVNQTPEGKQFFARSLATWNSFSRGFRSGLDGDSSPHS
jgi:hypothetical protein